MDENLKMLILAFQNKEMTTPAMIPFFKVHVNPENYSQSVQINYTESCAPGPTREGGEYQNTSPQEISFDFLLDRTGALGNMAMSTVGIEPEVQLFKQVALNYNGSIHRPNFLKLIWGTLIFDCQLKSLDVEYKMFNQFGLPLRAVLKTVFVEYSKKNEMDLLNMTSSPDLTHVRTVKEGDTLPLMTWRIYGDSKYYLEVAKYNKLSNFRNLKPGDELVFPPLK